MVRIFLITLSFISLISAKDISSFVSAKNISITEKLKVGIDWGNGASGCIAPKLYKALGCAVVNLCTDEDGNFANHQPYQGKPENLTDLIKKGK